MAKTREIDFIIFFFKNFRLAKHSDETSSCGIPSGSNTPQVADTCDPRISQGLEILQRYEVTYFVSIVVYSFRSQNILFIKLLLFSGEWTP